MQSSEMTARAIATAIAVWAISGVATAVGSNPLSFGKPNFDLTGIAYDASTKQPIEGAYVVAIYYKSAVGLAGSDAWCIKTRGMYTGKDGSFRFPIEKLDGDSPGVVTAIKPGFYSGRAVLPKLDVQKRQGKEAYTGRDTPLIPQDPAKPEYQYGTMDVFCARAQTREDAAAGIEFLRILLEEKRRLRFKPEAIESTADMIRTLESIPLAQERRK